MPDPANAARQRAWYAAKRPAPPGSRPPAERIGCSRWKVRQMLA